MFNKSAILVATVATFAMGQAAPLTDDKWVPQELGSCKGQLWLYRYKKPDLTYQADRPPLDQKNAEPEQCWQYTDFATMTKQHWLKFSSQSSGVGPTYVNIHSSLNYDPTGDKLQVKCISTASEENFDFQCDKEQPAAQSVDVDDQQSTPEFSPDTASSDVALYDYEQAFDEDDSSGLSENVIFVIIIGSVLLFLVLCISAKCYIDKRKKIENRARGAAGVQQRRQNQRNQQAGARQQRRTVTGTVVADNADAQQNNQIIIGEIRPGQNEPVYLAEDVNRRQTLENNQYGSLVVKNIVAASNQAENMDEENAGAAVCVDNLAMSECPAIHEAVPQAVPTAQQQQFIVMPPSDQDQSDPTNHV